MIKNIDILSRGINLRRLIHRIIVYPFLLPIILCYMFTKNNNILNLFYSIRSLPHGVPLRNTLRLAYYEGNKLLFPSGEDPFFDDVFLRDVYYVYKPQQDDVVVDVGAHMGFFSIKVAKKVLKVISIEPDPYNYKFLVKNLDINSLKNVTPINVALGSKNCYLYLKRKFGYGRTMITKNISDLRIKVKTLDSIIQETEISPSFIKIDTEGYEMQVLEGAKDTLNIFKPKLLIASYHYPSEFKHVISYLSQKGYLCYVYYVPLVLQKHKELYVYALHRNDINDYDDS